MLNSLIESSRRLGHRWAAPFAFSALGTFRQTAGEPLSFAVLAGEDDSNDAANRLEKHERDDGQSLARFMATRNRLVCSLAEQRLAAELTAAGLEQPQLLLQALGSRLWISRRP